MKSYSKDKVLIKDEEDGRYIIKIWNDREKGRESIRKQIEFKSLHIRTCTVRTPSILHTETLENGKFLAKMNYIDASSGIDIINRMSRSIVLTIKDVLGLILYLNLKDSKVESVHYSVFLEKLISIKAETSSPVLLDLLNSLILKLKTNNYLKIPVGNCHGDLTLSNMLISGNETVNLIDFLPSFIETPLWDVVKLEQDLIMGWSYRFMKDSGKINAKIFFEECIPDQFHITCNQWKYQVTLLSAINLARIVPYIKDDSTHEWIVVKLKSKLAEFC